MKRLGHNGLYNFGFLIRLFFILITLSLIYVVSSIFLRKDSFYEQKVLPIPTTSKPIENPMIEERRDYSFFLEEIEEATIFAAPRILNETSGPKLERQELTKKIEQLRLVGIMPKDPPRAMIEHTGMGKTFYLEEGETFLDNIKVEKIGVNSIILNCYGEEVELYL